MQPTLHSCRAIAHFRQARRRLQNLTLLDERVVRLGLAVIRPIDDDYAFDNNSNRFEAFNF